MIKDIIKSFICFFFIPITYTFSLIFWPNNPAGLTNKIKIKIPKTTASEKADEIYPGLFKPILIYNNTYNQDLGEYATIIEVGDDENTIEEAENSILLFANILKEILN